MGHPKMYGTRGGQLFGSRHHQGIAGRQNTWVCGILLRSAADKGEYRLNECCFRLRR